MNQKSARPLPTLAHPLIIDPEQGEKDEKSIYLPPFSDINLNWQSFTIPHLYWIGINETKLTAEEWQLFLIVDHEGCHRDLANSPFSQHKKIRILMLHDVIRRTFEDGHVEVEVPLDPYKSRNELEKEWGYVVCLIWESQLVEEVFAVRSSVLNTQKKFKMSHGIRRELEKKYKEIYGKTIHFFSDIYDAFDIVASKIGETATTALIYNVLKTINPQGAFIDILSCTIDSLSYDEVYHLTDLRKDSLVDAYVFFDWVFDQLDPDDSVYKRNSLSKYLALGEKYSSGVEKGEFTKFLFSKPKASLVETIYNSHGIHTFSKPSKNRLIEIQEVMPGNEVIVREAILHQLIKGIGLLCPFWNSSHGCYSRENRELLEKVWSCTKPDASCDWKPLGCLAKGGRV
jgi:hypothetical protein